MNNKEEIKLEALSLSIDESKRIDCPSCGRYRCDIQRIKEGILYNCWRPDCSCRGFVPTMASSLVSSPKKNKKVFEPKLFNKPTINIFDCFYDKYLRKYKIPKEYLNALGAKATDQYQPEMVMPLKTFSGYTYAWTTKVFGPLIRKQKKSIIYLESNLPVLHYSVSRIYRDTAILVEGWLDAAKISSLGYHGVALLGTELTPEKVKDIRKYYKKAVLLLDPDAWLKALKIKKEYGLFFDELSAVRIDEDPKDMHPEKLKALLDIHIEL